MKFIYISFLIGAMAFVSCNKERNEAPLRDAQHLLIFPTQEGKRLSDARLNAARLSYFVNNDTRKQVADFGRAQSVEYQKGVLSSKDIASLSAVEKINTYYLTFGSGREDTIQVEYRLLNDKEGRADQCFCEKPLVSIQINGETPKIEGETSEGVLIYTYERQ